MLPPFHPSHKISFSVGDCGNALALADKPIRQKGNDYAASGSNEPTEKRGENFFSELAQLIFLAFMVLIGAGIALFFTVPIGKAVFSILDFSTRLFGRRGD
jgi:hypothetical protein